MAAAGPQAVGGLGSEDWEKVKKEKKCENGEKLNMDTPGALKNIRKLCELFRGRFTESQSRYLLQYKNNDLYAAVRFILNADSDDLQAFFGNNSRNVDSVRKNDVIADLARRNEIGCETRQFVCQPCRHHSWWRKVPKRKPVSKCSKCRVRYDPIPRDQEFGWGRFQCKSCGHKFNAFAMMSLAIIDPERACKSSNYCYKCKTRCEPLGIVPPCYRADRPVTWQTHSCSAENCFNRCPVYGATVVIQICVHPKSRPRFLYNFGSKHHVSTGSTVDTFLTQDGDSTTESRYQPTLDGIPEAYSDQGSDN